MTDSFNLIYKELNLTFESQNSESEILEIISDRVLFLLENDKDLLMSYLYRLDIDEKSIDNALIPSDSQTVDKAIATLIMERQKQRIMTKLKYNVEPIEGWEF